MMQVTGNCIEGTIQGPVMPSLENTAMKFAQFAFGINNHAIENINETPTISMCFGTINNLDEIAEN